MLVHICCDAGVWIECIACLSTLVALLDSTENALLLLLLLLFPCSLEKVLPYLYSVRNVG